MLQVVIANETSRWHAALSHLHLIVQEYEFQVDFSREDVRNAGRRGSERLYGPLRLPEKVIKDISAINP